VKGWPIPPDRVERSVLPLPKSFLCSRCWREMLAAEQVTEVREFWNEPQCLGVRIGTFTESAHYLCAECAKEATP
jgi:DNA-directed RNA polymerase subunit RPC12/RpoP